MTATPSRDCIVFSSADWHTPYWTNKQHTARRLAARGWRILYVETVGLRAPNMASGRDWKRLWRRLGRGLRGLVAGPAGVEPGIHVLSPLTLPFAHGNPAVRAINQCVLRFSVRRFVRSQHLVRPVVWTYHPFMLSAVSGIGAGLLVYHCVDDLGAVPGVDAEAFAAREQALLKRCDMVFATSRPLERRCAAVNAATHYMPNVADADHFAAALEDAPLPADLAGIPGPRIVYHGVLSDYKVDFDLLRAVAQARPDWHLVLIGEEREGQSSAALRGLAALPNVHCLGHRDYAQLPAYLRGMAVGLLPTLVNDYTHAMFPMKFYEYLAAGVPVVSTPLDFACEPRDGLEVGGDAQAFVRAIERQISRGRLGTQASRDAVGDNVWDARLDKMLEILEETDRRAAGSRSGDRGERAP